MPTHTPTIGVVGVSGTGKSSTLNALFGTQLPVSHTTAGSKRFRRLDLTCGTVRLTVLDAPGLAGER